MQPCLGLSGNIGQTAVALGHAAHYSVGIGILERVGHATTMSRQAKPRPTEPGDQPRAARVYLPQPKPTVNRDAAAAMFGEADLRLRVGCRVDACGSSIAGPLLDPRGHYLHARAHEMAELIGQTRALADHTGAGPPAPGGGGADADQRAVQAARSTQVQDPDPEQPHRRRRGRTGRPYSVSVGLRAQPVGRQGRRRPAQK